MHHIYDESVMNTEPPSTRKRASAMAACMAAGSLLASGCSSTSEPLTAPSAEYKAALAHTAGGGTPPFPDAETEQAALQRVMELFADFSETNVAARVRDVYAEELFFRDGFKQFTSLDPLAEYMVRSARPLRRCTFAFEPPVRQGADYYLRWTMEVNLRKDSVDRVDQVIGMSHLRFDGTGKVVFQQDYWDPSDVLYRRIPVANWLIRKVKDRL